MLRQGVQGISDLITVPGLINLDFADVRTVMKDAGSALMGIGRGSGEGRAADAAKEAIASPLLEVNIAGAQGVLFNITGGPTLEPLRGRRGGGDHQADRRPRGEHHLRHGHRRAHGRRGGRSPSSPRASTRRSKRERPASQTTAPVEVASALRMARDREQYAAAERTPTAIPVGACCPQSTENGSSAAAEAHPDDAYQPAAWLQPRNGQEIRRGPQQEVEDLDIPAFLRRHR